VYGWINLNVVFHLTGVALANTCRYTGSLNIQGGSTVNQSTTYIIPSYRIPCDGVVIGWEFCYQIYTSSVTFYPSVWRWNESNYKLIHASSVNYTHVPQLSTNLTICVKYNLLDEPFSVNTNDVVGLYTTTNSLILTSNYSDNKLVYSVAGNHSIINLNGSGVTKQYFHVAIVAVISE